MIAEYTTMQPALKTRLQAAQQRLQAALLAGEDTTSHRQAIATIERQQREALHRQQMDDLEQDRRQHDAAMHRAGHLARAAFQRISESTPAIPTMEKTA